MSRHQQRQRDTLKGNSSSCQSKASLHVYLYGIWLTDENKMLLTQRSVQTDYPTINIHVKHTDHLRNKYQLIRGLRVFCPPAKFNFLSHFPVAKISLLLQLCYCVIIFSILGHCFTAWIKGVISLILSFCKFFSKIFAKSKVLRGRRRED